MPVFGFATHIFTITSNFSHPLAKFKTFYILGYAKMVISQWPTHPNFILMKNITWTNSALRQKYKYIIHALLDSVLQVFFNIFYPLQYTYILYMHMYI